MKEIYVCAFAKSGITWLVHLLSDLLNSPQQDVPGGAIIGCWGVRCDGGYVIRKSHWSYKPRRDVGKTVVFLHRDPRDVIVSTYHYCDYDTLDVTIDHLLRVYEKWVRSWIDTRAYTVMTRYRWLQERPVKELRLIVQATTSQVLEDSTIQAAVERQSFENMRKQLGDDYHFMRRGIVGDWRNHLNRAQGKRIAISLNQLMLEQGFVDDVNWWEELPE